MAKIKPYFKGDFTSEIMLLAMRSNMSVDQIKFEIDLFLELLKDAEKWRARNETAAPPP